jgi:pimeloyl-ACP methyl ester carboxylesterase
METVYFISGLGADERAFKLLDLSFCKPVFVRWLTPLENESMVDFAIRLKAQLPEEQPVIVGLSFGGMIGVEIALHFTCKKLILLSSAKTQNEIPFYLRWMRYFPLHKLVSSSFLKNANRFAYRVMGVHNRYDKLLFTRMLNEADDRFLNWAVDRIIHWRNVKVPKNTFHIHGTKDIILPFRFVRADYTIRGGEHLMVLNKPAEISDLLKQLIVS